MVYLLLVSPSRPSALQGGQVRFKNPREDRAFHSRQARVYAKRPVRTATPSLRTWKRIRELLCGVNRRDFPSLQTLERHYTVDEREEGVVTPTTDIAAWMNARATLTDDDAPSADRLTAETLDAETIRVAIPTVPTGTSRFLVCHD